MLCAYETDMNFHKHILNVSTIDYNHFLFSNIVKFKVLYMNVIVLPV